MSLSHPKHERHSPIGEESKRQIHWIISQAFEHWQASFLSSSYVEAILSLPSLDGIKGRCITFVRKVILQLRNSSIAEELNGCFQPDLPSDSAALHQYIHSGKITELSMIFEAWTEPQTTTTVEFITSLVASFTAKFPLRLLQLEWYYFDHAHDDHGRLQSTIDMHFTYFGNMCLENSEIPCLVYRFQSDTWRATLLLAWVHYSSGNRSLLLMLFDRELLLDEDGYLQMDDELRSTVARFN